MAVEGHDVTEPCKRRGQSDKKGRLKYNQELLKRILVRIEHVEQMQRTIFKGLEGTFNFQKPYLQKISCVDEVDLQICELLFQSQPDGLFPKDVASRLVALKVSELDRFKVTRRVRAMNRRLVKEIGQSIAEKRGHRWALTAFACQAWGETDEDQVKSGEEEEKWVSS